MVTQGEVAAPPLCVAHAPPGRRRESERLTRGVWWVRPAGTEPGACGAGTSVTPSSSPHDVIQAHRQFLWDQNEECFSCLLPAAIPELQWTSSCYEIPSCVFLFTHSSSLVTPFKERIFWGFLGLATSFTNQLRGETRNLHSAWAAGTSTNPPVNPCLSLARVSVLPPDLPRDGVLLSLFLSALLSAIKTAHPAVLWTF